MPISEMADEYSLSIKKREAMLSDRNNVIKAWLTKTVKATGTRESLEPFYFEEDGNGILQLVEYDGDEMDTSELQAIAELLIRKDRTNEVRHDGQTIAKLSIAGVSQQKAELEA